MSIHLDISFTETFSILLIKISVKTVAKPMTMKDIAEAVPRWKKLRAT